MNRTWWKLGAVLGCVLGLTACPEVEKTHLVVDRKANTLQIVYEGIRSNEPDELKEDLASVRKYLLDDDDDSNGFEIVSSDLYERDGRLDARVDGTFENLADIGFYRHDRRSPTIFCVERGSDQSIEATNGRDLKKVLPGCVAWDRRTKVLEVTVRHNVGEESVSLLPTFQAESAK